MTDTEIRRLWEEGRSEEAFRAIVSGYSERLWWNIRRICGSTEEADDLLQDVFVKAWNSLGSFRWESSLFTWMWRISTNICLNHLRKKRLLAIVSFEDTAKVLGRRIDEDPDFDGDELQRELYKAIAKLPEKQKLVFSLRYFDEMKYEDMSEILGTSVGALKASYHHAYIKVKTELEKNISCWVNPF
ncbi:MAG: sigma-70 family RNA polymerase sigma factor [Bacteroidales bacterium]|nr:sigma-70 family RNA polymerase sigma factor [Bacteroidales bacterium]